MLTLSLSGKNIPIPVDFSMRLTWKNPACDFEKIPSGYGLGLSFPISEATRAIFGNPHRFAKYRTENDQRLPNFAVRFNGVLFMAGTLVITSSSNGNYEGTLMDELGILGENEQERDILDFPVFSKDTKWQNSASFSPDSHSYCCFPLTNASFFKEKGQVRSLTVPGPEKNKKGDYIDVTYDVEVLTYAFERTSWYMVNKLEPNNCVKLMTTPINLTYENWKNGRLTVVSPYLFLGKIITKSLREVKFFVGENILDDSPDLRMLCIYNNFDITRNLAEKINTGLFEYRMVPVFHRDSWDDPGEWITERVAFAIKQDGYKRYYPESFKAKNLLPKMKLGDLLMSTQNLFNLCFHFLPDSTVNVYSREKLLSDPAIDLDCFFLGSWDIGEKKSVALNFTHEMDKDDLVFQERFNDMTDRLSDLREPVADWDELLAIEDMEEGDIRWMQQTNCFYEYRSITISKVDQNTLADDTKSSLGWDEFSIGFQNGWYKYGRKEVEEIKTSWSIVYGIDGMGILTNQKGAMNERKASEQSFSPRLMLYLGNNRGGIQNDALSLEYEKEKTGILSTLWKHWLPFWANRLPVSGEFNLSANALRYLVYNICKKYRTREGEFLIEEMSCDLYADHIGTTQIKGYKV